MTALVVHASAPNRKLARLAGVRLVRVLVPFDVLAAEGIDLFASGVL